MANKKVKTTETILNNQETDLSQVLLKKAMGYTIKETVDEFVVTDDEMKLAKRKVSLKYYPPDLSAIELVLKQNNQENEFANLTDQQLEQEKQKLIQKLKLEIK